MVAPARISSARTSAGVRLRTGAGPGGRGQARLEGGKHAGRQDRLEVLEGGAPHERVVRAEGSRGDAHRLALESECQEVEHVLAEGVRLGLAAELALDRREDGREGNEELGMVVGQGQESAAAAEPHLEDRRLESGEEAIARDG